MRVSAVDLHGEAPVAMHDSLERFELGIDFSCPPEKIAEALTKLFQDAVDSGRWQRHATAQYTQRPQAESRPAT